MSVVNPCRFQSEEALRLSGNGNRPLIRPGLVLILGELPFCEERRLPESGNEGKGSESLLRENATRRKRVIFLQS